MEAGRRPMTLRPLPEQFCPELNTLPLVLLLRVLARQAKLTAFASMEIFQAFYCILGLNNRGGIYPSKAYLLQSEEGIKG